MFLTKVAAGKDPAANTSTSAPRKVAFAHILRALAATMVAYCHLVGGRAEIYGDTWWPQTMLRTYVLDPMIIRQNFGFLGVAVFFLISGFVITYTAPSETRLAFVVKRLFRIFPPLIAAILLAWGLYRLHALWLGHETVDSLIPARDMLLSMTTLDVLAGTPRGALSVGWTLSIEVVFYAEAALIFPLIRRSPAWASAALIAWGVLGTIVIKGWLGLPTLAEMTHYAPLFAIGVGIAGRYRPTPIRPGVLLLLSVAGLCAYSYNLVTLKPWALLPPQMFAVQAVYAVTIFVFFAFLGWQAVPSRLLDWIGDISYSLYLIHVPVGFLVADMVVGTFGVTAAILAAVAAAFASAALLHVAVERPSQRLARSMLRKRRLLKHDAGGAVSSA